MYFSLAVRVIFCFKTVQTAPRTPLVVTSPMPKHGVNAIDEDSFVVSVKDIVTPLMTMTKNLLLAGLFPGCDEGFRMCSVLPTGCQSFEVRCPTPDG